MSAGIFLYKTIVKVIVKKIIAALFWLFYISFVETESRNQTFKHFENKNVFLFVDYTESRSSCELFWNQEIFKRS